MNKNTPLLFANRVFPQHSPTLSTSFKNLWSNLTSFSKLLVPINTFFPIRMTSVYLANAEMMSRSQLLQDQTPVHQRDGHSFRKSNKSPLPTTILQAEAPGSFITGRLIYYILSSILTIGIMVSQKILLNIFEYWNTKIADVDSNPSWKHISLHWLWVVSPLVVIDP